MSFDDGLADMHDDLFAEYGVPAQVFRVGVLIAEPRIIVDRNVARVGEFGQVIGRMDTVSSLVPEWSPREGDRVLWIDRVGANDKPVESLLEDDGFVAKAVLHG